jgi:hypothetical protein
MTSPTNSMPCHGNDSTIKPRRSASMETDQSRASKLKLGCGVVGNCKELVLKLACVLLALVIDQRQR